MVNDGNYLATDQHGLNRLFLQFIQRVSVSPGGAYFWQSVAEHL